ncbi:P-loop NTPase fold protein [Sphaerisporangium fuscum]|uniref:P-loop NTPase fold protein n=1 Tax=Sphaerisporangium fuscum TaxID=2835868 RepID=UPI001BDC5495|nr:P-loop NTPase fold protein [Sphaerisporangium fuscum]
MTSLIVTSPPAPPIRARKALVFLDRGSGRAGDGADRRLVHALGAEGYAVETAECDSGDHRRVGAFLDAVEPGDLLLVRWSTESGWGRREFGALMDEFARRVERSDGAALLLIVDFGWLVTANPAQPHPNVSRLPVRGEPVAAAAALTTSASVPGGRPGRAVSLTAILADGILSGEADLDGDGTVSVGDLYRYAEERCADLGADRRPYMLTYGEGELIPVAAAQAAVHDLGAAFGTALARLAVLGDVVPPLSASELVGRIYEVHLGEDARQLLRRAALLAEDEPVTVEMAELLLECAPRGPEEDDRSAGPGAEGGRPSEFGEETRSAPGSGHDDHPLTETDEASRTPGAQHRDHPDGGARRTPGTRHDGPPEAEAQTFGPRHKGHPGEGTRRTPGGRGRVVGEVLRELSAWGLLGDATPFADPAVRRAAAARLDGEELVLVSALLRRRRAARRAVRPRARLTGDRWTVHDRLGHRVHAEAVAAFVRHPDTRPPLTIGIKGPWGAGKTSLMRMVQDLLDPGAAEDHPAPIHLNRLRRRSQQVTNAEVLARASVPDDAGAGRAVPGELPLRDADWRPTVWFNPWMYQNGEQVWAGLAHEIISQVTGRLPRGERERFWLELNLARIDREAVRRRAYRLAATRLLPVALALCATLLLTAAALAASALLPAIGAVLRGTAAAVGSGGTVIVVAAAAVRLARFLGESADTAFRKLVRQPDLLGVSPELVKELTPDPGYRSKTGFLHLVQTDMRRVLGMVATEERPLVVFVDDLDRCSPGTVAQVIEAVNLFLAGEFPNCVFVLAMEPEVVAAHVEVAYQDLARTLPPPAEERSGLGWRFLEKIVQLPLSVPLLDDDDRIPAYLRTLLDVPAEPRAEEAAGREGDRPAEPELVDRMEAAIRTLGPTADDLDLAARRVQETLGGDAAGDDAVGGLSAEVRLAADRVYDDLYSDEKAYVAIERTLPALTVSNPRELKRYVNVFRFYSFVTYRQALAGAARASDEEVAKLAVLAIRWPHLLSLLARDPDGPGRAGTVLSRLEEAAACARPDEWRAALAEVGLLTGTGDGAGHGNGAARWDALHALLSTHPPIAHLARDLL